MRLKTFTAKTMQDAMAQVRATLGPDAIIVNTRPEGKGAKGGMVRITAAIDGDIPADPTHSPTAPQPKPVAGARLADLVAAADSLAFEHEVQKLDELLDAHRLPETIKARLLKLARSVEADTTHMALAAALDTDFIFRPLTGSADRPLIFIGPPGAGKTASIAKMAAAAALDGRPVRLVTTDTVRTGGAAQLEGYARLIKTSVTTASDPAALYTAIDGAPEGELVLVDTAGCNPYAAEDLERTLELIEAIDGEPVLVMSAGGDCAEVEETGGIFAELGARRMIVTRLDTARRYASLLTLAEGGNLAFAGVSATPYVGDAIQPLNPVSLARLLTTVPKRAAPKPLATAHSERAHSERPHFEREYAKP